MMSKEMKHTPTPWEYIKAFNGNYLILPEGVTLPKNGYADNLAVLDCADYWAVANAKHIVKCVNENEVLHARINELVGIIKELNYCEVYMTHEFNSLKPVIEAFSRRFGGNEVSRLTEKDDEEDCFENYHESGRKHQKMCDNILKKVNDSE